MSNAYIPMPSVAVIDPRLNLNQPKIQIILQGGENVSYQRVPALSQTSVNTSTFNVIPPSTETIVDPRIYEHIIGTVTFNATPIVGQTILQSGKDAFRSFPFASNTSNMTAQINDGQVNFQSSEYCDVLLRTHNNLENQQYNLSLCPNALDISANYADLFGTSLNPLGDYNDSTPCLYQRGMFPYTSVNNAPGATTASVGFDITEPLLLSPFIGTAGKEHAGFVGIRNLILTQNWANNLSRFWSHAIVDPATQPTINSIVVTFTTVELLVAYITPKPSLKITNINQYNYTSIEYYPQQEFSLDAGTSVQVSVQNLQLNSVPDTIVIFCRKSSGSRLFTDPDSYISITGINLTYFNKTGILGTSSQQQLFAISRKNGLNMSWQQFTGQNQFSFGGGMAAEPVNIPLCGSVIILKPALDLSLDDSISNGVQTNNQLQMTLNLFNQNDIDYDNLTVYVLTYSEGCLTIDKTHVVTQSSVVTMQDVKNAKSNQSPYIDFNDLEYIDSSYQGGKLKGFFKHKLVPFVKHHGKKIYDEILVPAAYGKIGRIVGLGEGGRKMSRASLRKRANY